MLIPVVPNKRGHYGYSNGLNIGVFDLAKMSLDAVVERCRDRIADVERLTEDVRSPGGFLDRVMSVRVDGLVDRNLDVAYLAAACNRSDSVSAALAQTRNLELTEEEKALVEQLELAWVVGREAVVELLMSNRRQFLVNELRLKKAILPDFELVATLGK